MYLPFVAISIAAQRATGNRPLFRNRVNDAGLTSINRPNLPRGKLSITSLTKLTSHGGLSGAHNGSVGLIDSFSNVFTYRLSWLNDRRTIYEVIDVCNKM